MPINFGTSGIGEIYYGSTPIKEVYAGSQLVWSSGPSWPQTGTWSGNTGPGATVASFTIPEAGVYNLEWAVTWAGTGYVGGTGNIEVNNGTYFYGTAIYEGPGTSTAVATSVSLTAGGIIKFNVGSYSTLPATGAWTVTKVEPLAYGNYNVTDPATGNYDVGTWTAPSAGTYTLYIDRLTANHPATVIVVNGTPIGGPEGTGTPIARTLTQSLGAGDVVVFRVSASPDTERPATGTWFAR